jgi:5-(carboxyamino)imidazole ribonucleotide mutase
MIAAISPLPVIGVPIKSSNSIDGWDSLLSIVQMPNGVPVATVAINAALNAGILAAQILGTSDPGIQTKIMAYKSQMETTVLQKAAELEANGFKNYLKK